MRMKGANVLHPMGWDAFGLPAEQYAIQTGVHPAITTRKAIDNFRRQLKRFGFCYDWSREFGTIDPEYYRWTQWIFLKAYDSWFDSDRNKARPIAELIAGLESGVYGVGVAGQRVALDQCDAAGAITGSDVGVRRWHQLSQAERRAFIDDHRLVYLGETTVNWCPALGTVLANDEVIDGKSERGGHPVLRKPLKQWMFRITAYAQRLLDDLSLVDWPESTKTMQAEWIGRSEGAEVDFEIADWGSPPLRGGVPETVGPGQLRVFTTRPDTIFGATYMVVAPEHWLVDYAIRHPRPGCDVAALKNYVAQSRNKAEVDRMADTKEKSGVFTGVYCVNPATGERIPVWTADYVLMGYGHGAIMAVPAHDDRDYAFAAKFGLPIVDVVYPRTMAAMAYFAEHAPEPLRGEDEWVRALADFLVLVTTANAEPAMFEEGLRAIVERRVEPPSINDGPKLDELPPGTPRGVIAGGWAEAVRDLFGTLEQMQRTFRERSLYKQTGAAFTGNGYAAGSRNNQVSLNGLPTAEAKRRIVEWLESQGLGSKRVNFKLRDWAFSRQRYWGEPFPIVYDEAGNHYPVSEKALPVTLPEMADYSPVESDDPQPLLAKASTWVHTTARMAGVDPSVLPPETPVRRETNTMPGSAGSSWYFLRYCDPKNSARFVGREAEQYWMKGGVDLYLGGSEHAVGHLLYARFWQKILFDLGEVSEPEPFRKLFHQGMITSFAYQRPDKSLVPVDEVDEPREGEFIERATGTKLTPIVAKMSKSLKNVVNPDDIIAQFGADTFRVYEMYMGPLAASKPWNTKDAVGIFRFLQRVWRVAVDEQTGELKLAAQARPEIEKHLHRMVAKVEGDIPKLAFNTAIAAMIEFTNAATSAGGLTRSQLEMFTLALAPFAPHIAEELWHKLGHTQSIAHAAFPTVDARLLVDDVVEIPVQIGGKVRARISVPAASAADKAMVEKLAMADAAVQAALAGKNVTKVVVVPGKMVNVVAG
jgi:leucyl-tRNA synthetase